MSEFIKGTNWSNYTYRSLQQELSKIRAEKTQRDAEKAANQRPSN